MTVRTCLTLAIVAFFALPARAQEIEAPSDPGLPPPVSLAYVDGEVQSLNQGAAERASAPSMLVDGDGIRTARGRAELVFGDGSVLHADDNTAVDLLGDRRLRVLAGRIVVRASAAAGDGLVIDTPAASLHVESRGEYSLAVDNGRRGIELNVARGSAEVDLPTERLVVRSGETVRLDGPGARPVIAAYNSARLDAFERWSLTRYEGEELSSSSRRLPTELRAYGDTFDRYGSWDYAEPYGQVWYPAVAADWRPYYNGDWRNTRYGMTWYGNDPWAWPTHHYGRWQFSNRWFWVPARVWSPAWVSWAYAPNYVSWAPLGWDSRPVVPFYLRVGIVNPDRWRAWTVMPRGYLGHRGPIRSWAIDGRRLPGTTSAAFIQQPIRGSRGTAYAVRRDGPGRPSGSSFDRAVPRGSYTDRSGVTRPGPATARGNSEGGAVRRDPSASAPRGASPRTFEQEWGGAARPRTTARPSADGSSQPASGQTGAVRRGDAAAYGSSARGATAQSRPRPEGDPAAAGSTQRSGTARGSARAPQYQRPAPSSGRTSQPRTEGARPRGESGRSQSEGRARSGSGSGHGSSSGASGGGSRSGSARRPPGR